MYINLQGVEEEMVIYENYVISFIIKIYFKN